MCISSNLDGYEDDLNDRMAEGLLAADVAQGAVQHDIPELLFDSDGDSDFEGFSDVESE